MSPRSTRLPSLISACLRAAAIAALVETAAHAHGTSHELIDAATREIAAKPGDAALYLRRAFLHLEHGDWHACQLDVDEAERRQTADLGADLLRGRALAAGGLYEEAKLALDRFIASHPGHAVALMERARVRSALGQRTEAADDAVLALAHTREPEPDQVFTLAAHLCAAKREQEALAAIDGALKAKPGLSALIERAIQIEVTLGRHDAALGRVDEALLTAKVKEPWMAKRAALLAQAGRTRESIAAWRELDARVAALPEAERGSHAMSKLAAQAHQALAALGGLAP